MGRLFARSDQDAGGEPLQVVVAAALAVPTQELRALDEVAYVRFASVYRRFQDVTEFQDEIQRLRSLSEARGDREQMSLPQSPCRKRSLRCKN